jgi:hypothetical protein
MIRAPESSLDEAGVSALDVETRARALVPKLPTVPGELAGAIRRGRGDGRLGAEHRVDVARARLLAGMLVDEATPRSAIAAIDRRLDVILVRLGIVAEATGPTELAEWLAGIDTTEAELDDEPEPDPPAPGPGPGVLELEERDRGESSAHDPA